MTQKANRSQCSGEISGLRPQKFQDSIFCRKDHDDHTFGFKIKLAYRLLATSVINLI